MFGLISKRRYLELMAEKQQLSEYLTEERKAARFALDEADAAYNDLEMRLGELSRENGRHIEEKETLRKENAALNLQLQEATNSRIESSEQGEVDYFVTPGAAAQLSGAEKPKRTSKRAKGQAVNVGEDGAR